jgi:hypothetical protein
MTKDEALRLALEALERSVATCLDPYSHEQVRSRPEHFINQAITAIKAALEAKDEPWEQFYPEMGKPKFVEVQDGECKRCTGGCPACDARKLPEQEPFGYASEGAAERLTTVKQAHEQIRSFRLFTHDVPLYTHPPQRTWVGLTEEEILAKCESVPDYDIGNHDLIQFAKAIEAKLKEKNL